MPTWLGTVSPWAAGAAAGYLLAEVVVERFPQHAGKVRAGAWIIGGAAIGTAIAPGLGTLIGGAAGGVIAWLTS